MPPCERTLLCAGTAAANHDRLRRRRFGASWPMGGRMTARVMIRRAAARSSSSSRRRSGSEGGVELAPPWLLSVLGCRAFCLTTMRACVRWWWTDTARSSKSRIDSSHTRAHAYVIKSQGETDEQPASRHACLPRMATDHIQRYTRILFRARQSSSYR